jgi:hypothetical protein
MSQTYEERVTHLQELYQNGAYGLFTLGVSSYLYQEDISTRLAQPLHHMVDDTRIQAALASWKRFGMDHDVPNTMMEQAENKLAYLDILEQDMFRLFKEARTSIESQKTLIINTIKQKEKKVLDAEKQDVVDRVVEREILHRLNSPTFPLDMVHHIGEFLFTPSMRLHCLVSVQPDIRTLMNTMKAPHVKRLTQKMVNLVHRFLYRIRKQTKLNAALPKVQNASIDIAHAFDVVRNPRKNIKMGKRKEQNIDTVYATIEHCNVVTNAIRKLGFSNTVQKLSGDIMQMFHTVHYASRPEWNARKTNRVK